MKATGNLRRVDEMGRVVIPKKVRDSLNLQSEDSIEIFVEEDKIVLQKYEPGCLFCDSTENTIEYMGKQICLDCLKEMDNSWQVMVEIIHLRWEKIYKIEVIMWQTVRTIKLIWTIATVHMNPVPVKVNVVNV